MKKLTIIIALIINTMTVSSQALWPSVLIGDTVKISVTGYFGNIQWQKSSDSITWSNIIGATTTPYTLVTISSPTNKWYYRAAISYVLCPNASPFYSSIICHRVITNTTQLNVCDWFHGGIVFYVDGLGNGLIGAEQDQSNGVQWGCFGSSIPSSASNSDGNTNTTNIYNNCTDRPIASSICYDLVLNNQKDWFLPAKDQLNTLYQQRALFTNFSSTFSYWSSTEGTTCGPPYFAYVQQFSNGSQPCGQKNSTTHVVRCIKSFSQTENKTLTTSNAVVTGQPNPVSISSNPQSQIKCTEGSVSFSVVANGSGPFSYQWEKNNVDISGATNSTFTVNNLTINDQGLYSCEVTNICRTVETANAQLRIVQIDLNAGNDIFVCSGNSDILSASAVSNYQSESGNITYSWSPSIGLSTTNIYNPIVTPTITSNYTVQATDQLGCTATDDINVIIPTPFTNEKICLVTIDTDTWKNKVIWEKTSNVGIGSYYIYKETSLNQYDLIGNVQYNNNSYFIDYSSVPESHADKYKISITDTCGVESSLSEYHKTMNLVISSYGSTMGLSWTAYEDESGQFVPTKYYIYRGTSPSNMQLLDSLSSSFTSYNDVNVFDVYYYMVGVRKPNACNTGSKSLFVDSYSNKKDNSTLVGIVEHNGYNLEALSISPNPFTESTVINFYNPENKPFVLSLTDATGKLIRRIENISCNEIKLEKEELKSGIYLMEIKGEGRLFKGKIMIN